MLALFFALGRFLAAVCVSCCVCSRSWPVFVRFWAPRVRFWTARARFWRVPGRSGEGFGGSKALFFRVVAYARACIAQKLRMRKNLGKTQVFPMLSAHHACCAQDKQRHKIAPGACRTELPTKIVLKTRLGARRAPFWRGLGHSWAPLGRHLAGFWPLLGGSWSLLGASWVPLGRFLGALWRLLAGLRRLLDAFWLPGTPRASILEGLGTCRAGFCMVSGACFGMPFAAPRAS